jgi:hypothetical protein
MINFDVKEIKSVLKNKAHCLSVGFSTNDKIIETLNEIRIQYISQVGLTTYLREMLGEFGRTPMQYCALYMEDGHRVELKRNGNYRQSVHRFIARHFQLYDQLPFKVEIHSQSNRNHVEICYL